jgi:hypothetical protein
MRDRIRTSMNAVIYGSTICGQPARDKLRWGAIANDRGKGEETTSLKLVRETRLLAGEKLNGRVALGGPDEVAHVMDLVCADACS